MNRWLAQLPNTLSVVRILLVPPLLWYLWRSEFLVADFLLLFAILTDALDGHLARALQSTSQLGAWLDASADKFLLWSLLILVYIKGWIPLWFFGAVLGRDWLMLGIAVVLRLRGVYVPVRPGRIGKWAIAAQMLVLLVLFLLIPHGYRYYWLSLPGCMLMVTVLLGYSSLWFYIRSWYLGVHSGE